MMYTYLLINFFTILIPFIYSFHSRIRFDRYFIPFLIAAILSAIPFLVWDAIFTAQGVWSFNEKYLTGIYLAGLPLEEILFFFCIPFSCVFTYHCLTRFLNLSWTSRNEKFFATIFCIGLFIAGMVFITKAYTAVTFISTSVLVALAVWILKIDWFGKAISVYAVLLIPFLIVNGILTGTGLEEPVVMYNDAENLGIRILTIPIEDSVYGFEMFFLILLFYHQFSVRKESSIAVQSSKSQERFSE